MQLFAADVAVAEAWAGPNQLPGAAREATTMPRSGPRSEVADVTGFGAKAATLLSAPGGVTCSIRIDSARVP